MYPSSIINEAISTISILFYFFFFFYEKILSVQKAPKPKTNYFDPLRSFCARKKPLPLLFTLLLPFLFPCFCFCW